MIQKQFMQKAGFISFLGIFVLSAILFFCPASYAAEEEQAAPAPEEIIQQFREAAAQVKSASYTEYRSDFADVFVVERHKLALKAYKPILDKISAVTRQDYTVDTSGGGYRETISDVKFIKPFWIQLLMVRNDYIPDFLQKSRAIYRPEINPVEAFLKEPYLGLMFRKGVEVDSAVTMVINWSFDQLELDCALANGGEITLAGIEQVDGRDAYRVDFELRNDVVPWNMDCAKDNYGIPSEAAVQMNLELGMVDKRLVEYKDARAVLSLWFDKESKLTIMKEMVYGDIVAIKSRKENIVLNKVNKKKMFKVKKP